MKIKKVNKGFLTTHVLDTSRGRPAANMSISISRVLESKVMLLSVDKTNTDGRLSKPILKDDDFIKGTYELGFFVGDYLKAHSEKTSTHNFFDMIPIRFNIWNEDEHYHVPLLLSPFGYSTYRGS